MNAPCSAQRSRCGWWRGRGTDTKPERSPPWAVPRPRAWPLSAAGSRPPPLLPVWARGPRAAHALAGAPPHPNANGRRGISTRRAGSKTSRLAPSLKRDGHGGTCAAGSGRNGAGGPKCKRNGGTWRCFPTRWPCHTPEVPSSLLARGARSLPHPPVSASSCALLWGGRPLGQRGSRGPVAGLPAARWVGGHRVEGGGRRAGAGQGVVIAELVGPLGHLGMGPWALPGAHRMSSNPVSRWPPWHAAAPQ